MRRFLAPFMIALACGPVLMPDAVRLPALVGHYAQHKEHAPEIGIVDFLVLHYADKEHQASGDSSHDQLPFHHRHAAGDNLPTVVLFGAVPLLSVPQLPAPGCITLDGDDPLAGHRHGLVQPPRC